MLEKQKILCYNKNGCRIKEITEKRNDNDRKEAKQEQSLQITKMKTYDGR